MRVGVAGETVAARRCVLATPLPPLRAVRFRPALPAALTAAIASTETSDEYWGHMEGAVRSGQRAAKEIEAQSQPRVS